MRNIIKVDSHSNSTSKWDPRAQSNRKTNTIVQPPPPPRPHNAEHHQRLATCALCLSVQQSLTNHKRFVNASMNLLCSLPDGETAKIICVCGVDANSTKAYCITGRQARISLMHCTGLYRCAPLPCVCVSFQTRIDYTQLLDARRSIISRIPHAAHLGLGLFASD